MQAILTKYVPATNTKGSRIRATCERGSITVDYPHELSGDAVHAHAAHALIQKFIKEDSIRQPASVNPWNRPFVTGCLPTGEYAHVFIV